HAPSFPYTTLFRSEAAVGTQRVEQAPDLRVGTRNLGVVRAVTRSREARPKRFRRFVRSVRVVQVEPRKKRTARFRLQPFERSIDDFGSRALNRVHAATAREAVQVEVAEIPIAALRDAAAP